jgi:hypothetical protein
MLWLDAKDSNTILLDSSGGVIKWYDKSGFGNDLSSIVVTGFTRPTYSDETITFNSNRMNICNSMMSASNFIMYPGLTAANHTFVALHKPLTTTGSNVGNTSLFDFSVIGSASCNVSYPTMTGTTPRGWIWSGTTTLNRSNSTLLDNSVTTEYNIISASIQTLRQTTYRNGVIQKDLSAQAVGTFVFNTTASLSAIGRFGKSNSLYYQGDVKELFVFGRALSHCEINQLESYLATKWNLTSLLPSNHMVFTKIPTAVASFNPGAFADANIWLDATFFSSNHSNNQTITSSWANWGSNSNVEFVRTGTPTYISNAYRGRPGVDLETGTFYASSGLGLPNLQHMTYAVVSRNSAAGADKWAVTYAVSTTTGPTNKAVGGIFSTTKAQMSNATGTQVGEVIMGGLPAISGVPFLVESYGASNSIAVSVNGRVDRGTVTFASLGNTPFDLMGIGRETTSSTPAWPGRIHEIIVYNNPNQLSEDDKLNIRAHLMNKWGITNQIPSNYYPYKGTAI